MIYAIVVQPPFLTAALRAEQEHLIYSNKRINSNYGDPTVFVLYRISPWLYCVLGLVLVVLLGSLVSLCVKDRSHTLTAAVEENTVEKRLTERCLTIYDVYKRGSGRSRGNDETFV